MRGDRGGRPSIARVRLPSGDDMPGMMARSQMASLKPAPPPTMDYRDDAVMIRQMNRPAIPGRFHTQLREWHIKRGMGIHEPPPFDPNIPLPRSGPEVPQETKEERRKRQKQELQRQREGTEPAIQMIRAPAQPGAFSRYGRLGRADDSPLVRAAVGYDSGLFS